MVINWWDLWQRFSGFSRADYEFFSLSWQLSLGLENISYSNEIFFISFHHVLLILFPQFQDICNDLYYSLFCCLHSSTDRLFFLIPVAFYASMTLYVLHSNFFFIAISWGKKSDSLHQYFQFSFILLNNVFVLYKPTFFSFTLIFWAFYSR